MISKRIFLFGLPFVLSAMPAVAQDEGLYPDPSSPEASFVRVHVPGGGDVVIDGSGQTAVAAGMTPYVEVAAGDVTVETAGGESDYAVDANTHYTVLSGEEGMPLITDGVTDSPAQADLLLYNVSDLENFDLFAVEADTAALADVAPGGHEAVGLQAPLTLTFELRQDGETLGALDPVELRRGTATTIIVSDGGEIAATTSTYAD